MPNHWILWTLVGLGVLVLVCLLGLWFRFLADRARYTGA